MNFPKSVLLCEIEIEIEIDISIEIHVFQHIRVQIYCIFLNETFSNEKDSSNDVCMVLNQN